MKRSIVTGALIALLAQGALVQGAGAQSSKTPVQAPGPVGAPAGTGAMPAIAEARADAPGYTIYRPAHWPTARLPLVLWGNGGCRDDGLSASHFLREIASHGYVVVANGAPRAERPVLAAIPAVNGPPIPPPGTPMAPPRGAPDETTVAHLLAAIDWIRGSDLGAHVDANRVAVMGHSCGGLQALAAGADPRIGAVLIFDSGVYTRANTGLSGVDITKGDLKKLHTPVIYVLGGTKDIAFPNGTDDFARIDHVPVFMASMDVGHGGTFALANGGDWARVGVAWLDWQIKGNTAAGRQFTGRDCGLCRDPRWTISTKHFPEHP